jgi:hypothetical protein
MSESNQTSQTLPNYLPSFPVVNDAWNRVGEAMGRATELYLKELTAYLDWARNVQREVLNQSLSTTQELSRLGEKQLAFAARLRESLPYPGSIPTGTETIVGMVDEVVKKTTGAA